MQGKDLAAPEKRLHINGQDHLLKFSNKAARIAEDVYEEQYGRPDTGYALILQEAAKSKHRAIMAIYYGALIAGGADMTWETFDESFQLTGIPGVKETLLTGVKGMIPPEDTEKK